MNRCIFCEVENEEVEFMETQDGWIYSCKDFVGCANRSAQNLVAKNLAEYHKGEKCKNIPEIQCQEGFCYQCYISKS